MLQRGGLLLAVVVGLLAFQPSSAQSIVADIASAGDAAGDTQLYLLADYAAGLSPPAEGPQLLASRVLGKGISCAQQHAVAVRSVLPENHTGNINADTAIAAVELPGAAACSAANQTSSLKPGLYVLQAARLDGADWPTWRCLSRPSVSTASAGTPASVTDVAMYSFQTVQLQAGSTYVCIATYSRQSQQQQANAASIAWDQAVAAASSGIGVSANTSGASCTAPAYKQPPRGTPAAPLTTRGSNIVDSKTNKRVIIHGINWFGFNVPMGMVDGLWAGGTDASTDFGTIAYQLSMLGYNAVRLPFTHNNLANTEVWDLVRECQHMPKLELRKRLVDPNVWSARQGKVRGLPPNPSPLANNPASQCNSYLPTTINRDRLKFVLQAFIAQGLYVVLDYQPMGLEQHAYNLDQFVGAWTQLWQEITCLPNFESDIAGRVFVDVMNEPDSMGIRWEPQGDRPGAEQLYLATAQAIWNISPGKVLFMFEGTGQNMFGLNWGNGFVTDKQVISSRGLSDPNNFFKALLTKNFARAVVFTPHVYPPTITKSTFLGRDLWSQSQTAFSYLQSTGYCDNGACTRFPVFVGETGSAYTDETDKQWLNDFSDFLMARGAAREFNKIPIGGWMWWAYNENSGDTGGIVMNQWQDLHWEKLRFMIDKLGLKPWWRWPVRSGTNSAPARPPVRSPARPPAHAPRPPAQAPRPPAAGRHPPARRPPPGGAGGSRGHDRRNSATSRPRRGSSSNNSNGRRNNSRRNNSRHNNRQHNQVNQRPTFG